MLSVLLLRILSVQIVYSVQLNCTDSNYREREWVLFWVCYCTAHLLYKYWTNCTLYNWNTLTIITQKLPLRIQLNKGEKLSNWYLLKWSADGSLKLYSDTYREIRSFRLTLLAASAVTQFDSDKKQVDVTKVMDKLCKLKAKSDNFILKCRYVKKFSESYWMLQ
jgi:hypothetical protein